MHRLHAYRRDEQGSSAVEFALVAPMFLALMFGIINLSIVLFGVVTMHFAAEDAARCYAVKTTVCTDAATTATYAASRYSGPAMSVIFTASKDGQCHATGGAGDGHKVVANGSYQLFTGLANLTVPVSASACFP